MGERGEKREGVDPRSVMVKSEVIEGECGWMLGVFGGGGESYFKRNAS